MSALQFCPSCGTKNQPVNGKPANFCCGCGHDLRSLAMFGAAPAPAPKPATRTPQKSTPALDLTVEQDEEVVQDAGFSAADVTIQMPQTNTPTVAQLLGTAGSGTDSARQAMGTKSGKRRAGKSVFTKFQDEAGKGGTKGTEIG